MIAPAAFPEEHSAMDPPAAPPDTEVRIPVSYQPFLGDRNPELKGRGFLTFAEGTYRFSGKNLGTFSFGTAEVRFAPDQIKNVAVVGSAVRFTMPAARARRTDRKSTRLNYSPRWI